MDNMRLCRVHWLGIISSLFKMEKKQPIIFVFPFKAQAKAVTRSPVFYLGTITSLVCRCCQPGNTVHAVSEELHQLQLLSQDTKLGRSLDLMEGQKASQRGLARLE